MKNKITGTLDFTNPAELLIVKAALVNFKKAPFISNQETIIIDEMLDRINKI
mgnify:FL=1|tara:strand:+ start:310 stop:465 length:156 start_codon:yes stop_codon:yes gene_type:complete